MKKIYFLLFFVGIVFFGFGQANLPVNQSSLDPVPANFTNNGTDTYSGGSRKFNTQGDWFSLFFDSAPGELTFDVGINNGYSGSIPSSVTFSLEESSDGSSWTNVSSYSDEPRGTKTVSSLNSATRYIRWIYDVKPSGSNVALKNVILLKAASSNNTDTEIYDPAGQPAAANIGSLVDTEGEAVDVFKMEIEDQGSGDGLVTDVTNIRVKPHTSNTADWSDNIGGILIDDGSVFITPASVDITDSYIDIAISSGDLQIADGGSEVVTLAVYLNTSNIDDYGVLSFMVDADDHGFAADASGSGFISELTLGDFNSNDFTIQVDGTQFSYVQQPSNVNIDVAMSPSVQIAFADANGNADEDYNGVGYGISLTTTGTFAAGATTSVDAVNGVATFDNIKLSATGTGYAISANDEDGWGMSTLESDEFDVTNLPSEPSSGDLIITELCGDGISGTASDDGYIEVFNNTTSVVSLDNITARYYNSNPGGVTESFELNGSINPGESVVLTQNGSNFLSTYGIAADFSGIGDFYFNGGDDGVDIYHNTNGVIDEFNSAGSWNWNDDYVYERISNGSGAVESNWYQYQTGVGTPKALLEITWDGSTDNDWGSSSNWDKFEPGDFQNSIIPVGLINYPTISGASSCYDLTIKSNATGDASILGQANLTVNGTTTVERYISGYSSSSNGWHFLASPVNSMTIAGSDFATGTFDLYRWGETTSADEKWLNFEGGTFGHTEFESGLGYLLAHNTGGTFKFTGALNSMSFVDDDGDVDNNKLPLTYTAGEGDGWNLIGNPYPSGLDWAALDKSAGNIGGSFYIVNPADGTYKSSNGAAISDFPNGQIPPHQGFFVQVSAASSIGIATSDQVHTSNQYEKSSNAFEEILVLDLNGDNSSNKTYFQFRDDATEEFDFHADAYKLFGWATIPQIYSEIEGTQYSINCLNHSEETVSVPLGIYLKEDQELTLDFSGMDSFYNTVRIDLEDKETGSMINIIENPSYTFQATTEDNANRFLLHFNGVTAVEELSDENAPQIYAVEDVVYINHAQDLDADVFIYNTNGQLVGQDEMSKESMKRVSVIGSAGIYLVTIQTENSVYTEKVYIK